MTLRRVKAVLTWDPYDAVWVSYVPELDNLSTYGETRDEVDKTREAVLGYLKAAAQEGIAITAS